MSTCIPFERWGERGKKNKVDYFILFPLFLQLRRRTKEEKLKKGAV